MSDEMNARANAVARAAVTSHSVHSCRMSDHKPYELQGLPRMHIHKVREVEEMVWYRENSLRFMKLSKPHAVFSILSAIVFLPYIAQNWLIWNNVCSLWISFLT